ncbi:MAG: hypothetical protein ABL930_00810 [Pseudobdellovibrio sp.]
MKIKITILTLTMSFQTFASEYVKNDFWSVPVPQNLTLKLAPLSNNDCSDYQMFIDENSKNLTSEDVDFARKLPIKGQMKDAYQADFLIKNESHQSDKSLVSVVLSDKIKIAASFSEFGLSYLSRTLGLEIPQIAVLSKNNELIMRIYSRDLACDIFKNKVALSTTVEVEVAPLLEEQLKLAKFYGLVADKTLEVLHTAESNYVKAAMLGIEYAKINKDIKPSLGLLFKSLFKDNSIELNNNWSDFAGSKIINYPKSQKISLNKIKLSVEGL